MTLHPLTPSRFPARTVESVAALGEVRAAFATWLTAASVDAERVEDMEVVVSELAANAVRETPPGASPARFGAVLERDSLRIEVSNVVDASTAANLETEWDLDDPLRTGGRGLLLVSAFVDEVAVELDGDRLVVRAVTRV